MARYNLRRGEGDRTSALRLSLIVFAFSVLTAILRAHHVPLAIEEAKFLFSITGWSVVWGIFTWLIYVGLEPHAQHLAEGANVVAAAAVRPLTGFDSGAGRARRHRCGCRPGCGTIPIH